MNDAGLLARVDTWVATVRRDTGRRRLALAVAVGVGLLLSAVHWLGFVAGGALVGLTRRSLPRALLAGFGFGLLALGSFVLVSPTFGPVAFVELTPLSYVTIALGLLASTWGGLARGAL